MHELGIARNIVAIVGEAAAGRRVVCVTLEIGDRAGVEIAAITFCWDVVSRGTPVEGARLDIVRPRGDELKVKTMELAAPD